MQQGRYNMLIISIANPILVGVYKDNLLIENISREGRTSLVLPSVFDEVKSKYNIVNIFYVNGPGSYMAIKITYIFLKTISIVNKINLFAVSGFDFNNNSPIKALGKKFFFRHNKLDNDNITIEFLNNSFIQEFILPEKFINIKYSKDTLPKYNLPAV
jgi:tRNA A37 threonylcarbamoyladenosine modification protein TsaB